MKQSEQVQLGVDIEPTNAQQQQVNWTVTPEQGAVTIDATGKLTAGESKIGISVVKASIEGTNISDTLIVTIKEKAIALDSISAVPTILEFKDREPQQVTVTFTPDNAQQKKIDWVIADEAIATYTSKMQADGTMQVDVIPLAVGETTLTGTAVGIADTSKNKVTITIKVQAIPATTIKITNEGWIGDSITIKETERKWVEAVIKPSSTTDQKVTWTLEGTEAKLVQPAGESVPEQLVTTLTTATPLVELQGLVQGQCVLTSVVVGAMVDEQPVKDTLTIKVKGDVGEPSPEETTLTINNPGKAVTVDYRFTATMKPASDNVILTWTTKQSNIATIDATTGKVIACVTGKAIVQCTADTGETATLEVRFKKPAEPPVDSPTEPISGNIQGTAQIYFGPSASDYVHMGTVTDQDITIFHQEGDWYFIECMIAGQKARGYTVANQVSATTSVGVRQLVGEEKYTNVAKTTAGPNPYYYAAGSVSKGEVVQVFDLVEQQDGYESYTFVEYNTADGKKRAYMPTGMIYKSPDDVRYYAEEFIQGTVYDGWVMTQGFNDKTTKRRGHLGYDLVSGPGQNKNIYPIFDGIIRFKGSNGLTTGGNGHCFIVEHTINGETFYSVYGHLDSFAEGTAIGTPVSTTTILGIMGGTGVVPPHLHLGVFTGNYERYVSSCVKDQGCFPGYSHSKRKIIFELSGHEILENVPYAYNGYYFDGPRTKGNVFYDPIAVIYSNAGVITRHKKQ